MKSLCAHQQKKRQCDIETVKITNFKSKSSTVTIQKCCKFSTLICLTSANVHLVKHVRVFEDDEDEDGTFIFEKTISGN